jgi:hypothetical protein
VSPGATVGIDAGGESSCVHRGVDDGPSGRASLRSLNDDAFKGGVARLCRPEDNSDKKDLRERLEKSRREVITPPIDHSASAAAAAASTIELLYFYTLNFKRLKLHSSRLSSSLISFSSQ